MSKRIVAVNISGQEYRIRSDADEASLQRVARLVDSSMSQVSSRTGTVDTLDVAVLTSLNLARELLALRERSVSEEGGAQDGIDTDPARVRELIELAESGLLGRGADGEQTPLLTVPAGFEVEDTDTELLGTVMDRPAAEPGSASR